MKKIKILHGPLYKVKAGTNKYIMTIWRHLDKNKFHCDFLTFEDGVEHKQEIIDSGSKLYYISAKAEENKEIFIKEIKNVFANGYDIFHIHTTYWQSYLLEELAMECGVKKVIVHSHNSSISTKIASGNRLQKEEVHNKLKNMVSYDVATDFWACSDLAALWLFGEKIDKEDIVIARNAVDIDSFIYDEKIRNEYRFDYKLDDKFVVGFVGRLEGQKNIPFLCEMFNAVCKIKSDAHLIIIGEGSKLLYAKKYFYEHNISDKVTFLGFRYDVNKWLQAFDVFCLPSLFEGLPIVLVEAQMSGLKCIASENITKEVNINGLVEFERLIIDNWASKISDMTNDYNRYINRLDYDEYEIRSEIKRIEQHYLEQAKSEN